MHSLDSKNNLGLKFSLHLQRGNGQTGFKLDMQGCFTAPITALCGASGAGKSTLLALFAGLLKPEQGFIQLNGKSLTDTHQKLFTPPHLRHIGLMWQDGQLFPHLTVRQNLMYGYLLQPPLNRRFSPELVIELLEISTLLDRQPRHLSGGERQRVALGRTLLAMPQLLLLDEPLNALNQSLKQPILAFLKQVPTHFGIPLIYVTHQIEETKILEAETWSCEDGQLIGI
jgi:molybdate transport system ATP-binding protein